MEPKALYLQTGDLSLMAAPAVTGTVRYAAEGGSVVFKLKADKETEVAGPIKLKLWVEAEGADDMDVFAQVYKVDAQGKKLFHIALPGEAGKVIRNLVDAGKPIAMLSFAGPQGRLRASHRALEQGRSTILEPFHAHTKEERLIPGQIVAMEIAIWPVAMKIHAGETLCLAIGGQPFDAFGFPGMPGADKIATRNRGTHIIHTGGQYDSHVVLPLLRSRV